MPPWVGQPLSLTEEFGECRALILTKVTIRWGSEAPASAGANDTFNFRRDLHRREDRRASASALRRWSQFVPDFKLLLC